VLAFNPTIKVLMLPGDYHASEGATVGSHAVSFLGNFYADCAVTGASGLTVDGPSEALLECGAVYTAMVARAAKCVVVADHSKFDAVFPSRYASWRDVDALVTDASPPDTLTAALKQSGVELVTAA
jgi:DeoR/GlpR family transcriptional regulator of sugar metabolism